MISPKTVIITFFILALLAVVFALIIYVLRKEQEEAPDWAESIHRPCCKYCAYWYDGTTKENPKNGYCEKHRTYQEWDGCCLDYDGIDTEVVYGETDQGSV